MPEDVHSHCLDIFRRDIAAPLDEGMRAGSLGQKDGGARRRTELDQVFEIQLEFLGLPRGEDQLDDVVL